MAADDTVSDDTVSDNTVTDAARAVAPRWAVMTILTIAGVFYAYALWNAVGFLISSAGAGLSGYGWFVLLFAVVFPLVVLGVVYVLTRKRSLLEVAVAALAGLGLVAVFWLNVIAHFIASPALFTP